MDDNTNYQNIQQTDPSQAQQPAQNAQQKQPSQVSVSGSPEASSVEISPDQGKDQSTETQPNVESGYEKIKAIEKAVEKQSEQAEKQKQPQQKKQKQKKKIEKKDVPNVVTAKPKYFGYKPSKRLASDPNFIKASAGKGNKQDSKTWLLVFLDRVLKKESA